MTPQSNKKPLLLALMLLVLVSVSYLGRELFQPNIDPLKEQGLMLEQLSQLSNEELAKLPKKTGIDLAMLQDFKRTKDLKLGYVPSERKIEAYKMAKSMIESRKAGRFEAIPNVTWQERGPNNLGGRTRAMMFDPNDQSSKKVWAAGISGGLWYTNDITTDAPWTAVDDFMSNLAISCIAYDPNNTDVFYMGTGEGWFNGGAVRGAGIWKTSDGGSTWEQLASTINGDFYFTQKIAVLNDGSILAGTHSGIMQSSDGGETWNNRLFGRIADIEAASDGSLFASVGIFEEGEIYKSTNNGIDWSVITPSTTGGQRIELAVAPSNQNVIYAVASGSSNSVAWFKKSTDAGTSWSDIAIPLMVDGSGSDFTRGQAWYDLILSVFPDNADRVIAGGIDLHISNDGGTSWTGVSHWYGGFGKPYVHADNHAITFRPGTNNEAVFGNDGGVFFSSNLDLASPSFTHTVNGYNVTQFYSCALANDSANTFLAGAQDNGTHLFKQEGVNATVEVYGGDGAYCFISQTNPNLMIASYVYNNYYVTTNGWDSYTDLPGNDQATSSGDFINPAEFDSKNNILYSCHNNNKIRRVSNVGIPGTSNTILTVSIGSAQASALKVSSHTDNRLFVGTYAGRIFRIDNAHQTPTVTEISDGLNGGTISSIDVGDSDNQLLATVSNYGEVSVYESTDGGENWVNKEGNLPDMPVRWGLYNPINTQEVLIATEVGVWSTSAINIENPEWEPTIEGLANVRCDMLKYRASDGLVAIATYGRGLFTTDVFEGNLKPQAAFSANATVTYTGKEIQFTDASILPDNNWSWSFGDGETSTEQNPTHIYEEPGFYEVKLTIANGQSEKVRASYIQVLPNKGAHYSLAEGGDFESNESDFGVLHISGTSFERGKSTRNKKSGTVSGNFAWVTGIDAANYDDFSTSYLLTPNFLIGEEETILKFKTKYALEADWDGFIVEYSLDKGGLWTKLGSSVSDDWYNTTAINEGQNQNVVFTPGEAFFSGSTNNQFIEKSFDLASFAGMEVAFRFSFKTDPASTDAGVVIDDFEITKDVDLFLGSKGNKSTNSVMAYPNPTTSVSTFKIDHEILGLGRIYVTDIQGKTIQQFITLKSDQSLSLEIDLGNRPTGTYFVRAYFNDNTFSTKIIKE